MLYSGEQFDADLQMQYLRARFYDQNTGRFPSLDTFAGNSYDPQSLHKYNYCHNDPVNGKDPSGEFTLIETICAVAIATLIVSMEVTTTSALAGSGLLQNRTSMADEDEKNMRNRYMTILTAKLYGLCTSSLADASNITVPDCQQEAGAIAENYFKAVSAIRRYYILAFGGITPGAYGNFMNSSYGGEGTGDLSLDRWINGIENIRVSKGARASGLLMRVLFGAKPPAPKCHVWSYACMYYLMEGGSRDYKAFKIKDALTPAGVLQWPPHLSAHSFLNLRTKTNLNVNNPPDYFIDPWREGYPILYPSGDTEYSGYKEIDAKYF